MRIKLTFHHSLLLLARLEDSYQSLVIEGGGERKRERDGKEETSRERKSWLVNYYSLCVRSREISNN